ncbi:hypothetical protein [Tumebacillus flagellatus]|uniref:Ferric oxidoreductase domain-containing protein n=1 Tax=Tumebacillus flagellatus TaxID=1157490 RepID=A0A074LTR0_9BACL|nr:hypothetical protein [Tumebacillus flagellatus]KEO84010.1 hypothetical protein EL26_07445 [Tumebacillus flagellatus]
MPKGRLRIWLPAIVVLVAAAALIVYYFTHQPQRPNFQGAPGPRTPGQRPPAGMRPPMEEGSETFTLLGNIAIAFGALSFWWFLFKKKLGSPNALIKKTGKLLYKAHTFTGYLALILTTVHGGYYLITKFSDVKTKSGLAGFLLLLTLAVYGMLYKRVKNKDMRKTHFVLTNAWLVVLCIHAGGFFFFMIVVTVALWALLWLISKRAQKPALHTEN